MEEPKVTVELTDWRKSGVSSKERPFQIERVTNSIMYKAGERLTANTVVAMIDRYKWTVVVRLPGEGDRLYPT